MLPFVAREFWPLWCLQQQILYCNRYICVDVLSYSCSYVSFFSLSLSVGISPGLVPEAKSVCFLELGFMYFEGSFFCYYRVEWFSIRSQVWREKKIRGGRGDLMTKTVTKNVHWKGIKAPELGLWEYEALNKISNKTHTFWAS
jgi:hypothetical protein